MVQALPQKTATRTAAPPAPAPAPVRATAVPARVQLQSALRVSSPRDPAEKEAEATARKVMRMPAPGADTPVAPRGFVSPYISRFADAISLARSATTVARKADGQPNVGANVSSEISSSIASGSPLPLGVRRFMEPRFGADFSGVRIHTGDKAAGLNRQFNAQAFAVGNQIFFGRDKFKPETNAGKELIAHELTHTIQQGSVVQRSEAPAVTEHATPHVQRLGLGDALDYFADKANLIPGFRMFTIVLGVNPINMNPVERSAANIMRAIVEFIPGGGLITQALDNHGVFEKVGAWVEQQIRSLGLTGAAIKAAVTQFLNTLSWTDIFDLGGVWARAKRIFSEPIDRLISFAKQLIVGILKFIKDAILRPLAKLAEGTRGYDLLKALLGQDPVTGEPVPQNAETLIGGFMKLIGQEEVWQNVKKSNAIARAWAWFQGAMGAALGFVREIPGLFLKAFQSLEILDVVIVPRAFAKIAGVFGSFIGRFISWAGSAVWKLLEIIFEVVSPAALGYIRRTGAALMSILKNPLPFVGNLVKAAKLGFMNFADRIGAHLKSGLIDWLTGSLPGVYIPKAFELGEIVKFVFSVLGISWANVRQKLVKVVGEPVVKAMETGFDIVVTLVTQGPAAAWDKIKEQLTNLKDMVIGGITDFVVDTIVKKAIPKLIAMFIPGAGFISAIISIYDTIMVFVQKISKIIQVVTGFIDSIVAIASGAIGAAAKRVESVLASLLSLAISFLAGFLGLGGIADKIMGVINKVRVSVDKAIDALIAWIVKMAKSLFNKVFGKKDAKGKADERTEEQKKSDLAHAVKEGTALAKEHGEDIKVLQSKLIPVKDKYRLVKLDIADDGGVKHHLVGEINPTYPGEVFTAANLDELLAKVPDGAKTDVRAAIKDAKDKQKAVQDIFDAAKTAKVIKTTKTNALGDDITISGWGTLVEAFVKLVKGKSAVVSQQTLEVRNYIEANAEGLKKYGYETKKFVFDPTGAKGVYFQSHAEKQAFVAALSRLEKEVDTSTKKAIASIGVTRPMCPDDCFPFFKAVAQLEKRIIVVADPLSVLVFMPSGDVLQRMMPGAPAPK